MRNLTYDPEPGTLLLYSSHAHGDFPEYDRFYREEHIPMISELPGYVRSYRYKLTSRMIVSCGIPQPTPGNPEYLALHEFNGEDLPWEGLGRTQATEWSEKISKGMGDLDWGCFRLAKAFPALKANL